MVVVQVALELPKDIQDGIAKGILKISGSVVRQVDSGVIVRHLKETNIYKGKDSHVFGIKKVSKIINNVSPKTKLIVGSSVILGLATTGAYYAVKQVKKKNEINEKVTDQFNQSLFQYIDAATNKRLTPDTIKKLEDSLELIMTTDSGVDFNILIDSKEIKDFVNLIYYYTRDLAGKNSKEIQEIKRTNQDRTEDNIIDLQKFLKVQKKIFEDSSIA